MLLRMYILISQLVAFGLSHPQICFVNHLASSASAYITGNRPGHGAAFVESSGGFLDRPSPVSGQMTDSIGKLYPIAHIVEPYHEACHRLPGYLYEARIWAVQNDSLEWRATVDSMSQPTLHANYALMEFSYSEGGIYINPSDVDLVSPAHLSFDMTDADGTVQDVLGLYPRALESTCDALHHRTAMSGVPWNKLCIYDHDHEIMRIEAPYTHLKDDGEAYDAYFKLEVDRVWARFTMRPLTIRLLDRELQCQVDQATQQMKCGGSDRTYPKPTAKDILTCDSGPFATKGNAVHRGVAAVLCAAFNRGTLMLPQGDKQPHGVARRDFYPEDTPCNWYAAEVHAHAWNGTGAYATQYDDVISGDGKESCAQKHASHPHLIKVHIGPRPMNVSEIQTRHSSTVLFGETPGV